MTKTATSPNGERVNEQRIRERAYELWEQAGCPDGQSDEFWSLAQQEISMQEADYDQALEESFPASDPPAHSGIT